MTRGRPARPLIDRFHEKYFVHPGNGCWLWTGAKSSGYGVIGSGPPDHRPLYAHRVSYEHFVGQIPHGLVIDHACNTPRCVNPDHLQPLTQRQNFMRSNHPNVVACWLKQCTRGHDMSDPANVYTRPNGKRCCLVCLRIASARAHQKLRAARRANAA